MYKKLLLLHVLVVGLVCYGMWDLRTNKDIESEDKTCKIFSSALDKVIYSGDYIVEDMYEKKKRI